MQLDINFSGGFVVPVDDVHYTDVEGLKRAISDRLTDVINEVSRTYGHNAPYLEIDIVKTGYPEIDYSDPEDEDI